MPGTTDIGNNCDDCTSPITLPFTYTLYDTTASGITAGSNGGLFFSADNPTFGITCIPNTISTYTIAPFWDGSMDIDHRLRQLLYFYLSEWDSA